MLIVILIAFGLYSIARKREMNRILWPVLGVVAWFAGAAIGGFVLAITDPRSTYDDVEIAIYAYVSAVICVALVFVAQQLVYNRGKNMEAANSDEIMDDSSIEEL